MDGRIFVLQKQELTELIDHDGDELTDEYRCVAAGWGVTANFHEFAFGLVHGEYRGQATVSHGGADAGYRSHFLRFPDQGLTTLDRQPVLAALTGKGKRTFGHRLPEAPIAGITLSLRFLSRTARYAGSVLSQELEDRSIGIRRYKDIERLLCRLGNDGRGQSRIPTACNGQSGLDPPRPTFDRRTSRHQ